MSFFSKRKSRDKIIEDKEAEIQAIRQDTYKKIEEAVKPTEQLIDALKDDGITGRIFLATGGDKRIKRK